MFNRFSRTLGLIVFALVICMQTPAYAVAETNVVDEIYFSSEDDITPYADVIILKTRIHNGVAQYRHWNETRGYWVEDDWIDLP